MEPLSSTKFIHFNMHICIFIGNDADEAGVDLEIMEVGLIKEDKNAIIVSDKAGFVDEIGIGDETSSEIHELTAKESCEVSICSHAYTHAHTYTHTHTHTHTRIHTHLS